MHTRLSLTHDEARMLRKVDTSERDAQIKALRAKGLTVIKIGEQVGVHPSQVSRIAGPMSLAARQQRAERVRELHAQGKTTAEIAVAVGLTPQRVRQILTR